MRLTRFLAAPPTGRMTSELREIDRRNTSIIIYAQALLTRIQLRDMGEKRERAKAHCGKLRQKSYQCLDLISTIGIDLILLRINMKNIILILIIFKFI